MILTSESSSEDCEFKPLHIFFISLTSIAYFDRKLIVLIEKNQIMWGPVDSLWDIVYIFFLYYKICFVKGFFWKESYDFKILR